jgi:hypothetical protein
MRTKYFIAFVIASIFLTMSHCIVYNFGYNAKHTPNYIYTNDHRSYIKAMRMVNIEFTTEQTDKMFEILGGRQ